MIKKLLIALGVLAAAFAGYFAWLVVSPMKGLDRERELAQPALRLESYKFDPSSPVSDRIGPPPPFLLEFAIGVDNAPEYKPYAPSPAEKKIILDMYAALPARMKKTFRERLLGVYFIDGFRGGGLSNLVPGPEGRHYGWMVLNPSGFKSSLSEVLSVREDSVFTSSGTAAVMCPKLPGVFYSFNHEAAHVYDYVAGITPYVEAEWYELLNGRAPPETSWGGVWEDFNQPVGEADFEGRTELRFYGFGGGPRIEPDDAGTLYAALRGTPFISLYGSQNWAEDAAELFFFGMLARRTGKAEPLSVAHRIPKISKLPAGPGNKPITMRTFGIGEFFPGPAARARSKALLEKLSR